jgi:hypothetical protein
LGQAASYIQIAFHDRADARPLDLHDDVIPAA